MRGKAPDRERVLVVEDDTAVAGVIRAVLEDEGYVVEVAGSADTVRDILLRGKHEPAAQTDVILLDLTMPGADPVDALMGLREQGETVPPVVVMSGMPDRLLENAAQSLGAVASVNKPFTIEELLQGVREALPEPENSSD
jgi:two-component system nitrogen regulation response regulator NtrX